jgi:hypothetical protein
MPNVRAVICLGKTAEDFLRVALGKNARLQTNPAVFVTPHPAAHGAVGACKAVLPIWKKMAEVMGWSFNAS